MVTIKDLEEYDFTIEVKGEEIRDFLSLLNAAAYLDGCSSSELELYNRIRDGIFSDG